jgi:hypothetical protein
MAVVKNVDLKGRAGAHKGMVVLTLTIPTATEAVDQNVFVADQAYQLVSAEEAHSGVGGSAAAVGVKKATGTTAPAGGLLMIDTAFSLTSTINTVVSKAPSSTLADTRLAAGDRIALAFSGTVAGVDGVAITLKLIPDPDKRYWLSNA